jgi:hypothetical protein
MPKYEKYDNETQAQADARIAKNKATASLEDVFMDSSIVEDSVNFNNYNNMSEEDVKVAQTGLNLLNKMSLGGQGNNYEELKVDGVLGQKTLLAFNNFYSKLPEDTKKNLSTKENPLINVSGKNV